MIKAPGLTAIEAVSHGFFTREGGHSTSIYASLNTGLGSDDNRASVLQNRNQVREHLDAEVLVTP